MKLFTTGHATSVPKSLKPLQGLKPLMRREPPRGYCSKKPETLTGIETSSVPLWVLSMVVPKSLKPLQGLKRSVQLY